MEAIDGSEGFDFSGTYLEISNTHIKYMLDDGRIADVNFIVECEKTAIEIMFDPETTYPKEFQQQGWQAILDSFKNYIEKL